MFKKLTAIIICLSLIFCNAGIVSADLGQNPPQPVNNPNIISVSSSVTNVTAGNVNTVRITVTTVNINDGAEISAQLMSDDLSTPASGVNSVIGQVSNNCAALNLSIPASVEKGAYKIKVDINSLNLTDTDTSLTINPQASVPVIGVVINKSAMSLVAGTQESLIAEASPADATDKGVTWSSNNPSIATVDDSGKVTAISTGSAKITVTTDDGSKTASCMVTVLAATVSVNTLTLDKSTLSLSLGTEDSLMPVISPANATNKKVTWSSSNSAIATVDNGGKVTALAAGSAIITASSEDGNKSATCQVTVTTVAVNVTGVSLNKGTTSVNVGAEETLIATIVPSNATNKNVTWSSSNTGVATVSSTGVVRGIAAGTATITVTTVNGSRTATCQVTVVNSTVNVTGVSLNKSTTSINVAAEETLTATVAPSNATNKSVTWSSSNTGVATVSSAGVVRGIAAGTAIITVTTVNGSRTATCQVTVTAVSTTPATPTIPPMPPTQNTIPAPTPAPTTPVISMGKGTASVEAIPVINTTTGVAVARVSENQIKKAVEVAQASTNSEVDLTLKVEAVKDVKGYTQELPASVMTAESKVNKIEIDTPVAKVEFKTTMFDKLKTNKTDVVGITIEAGKSVALPEELGKQIGDRPIIDLNVSVNGANVKWDNVSSPVTVEIPYKPTAVESTKPQNIVIWYINDDRKVEPVTNCKFDPKTNVITFKTTHFSQYAVVFVEKSFSDLKDVKWAANAIEALASRSVINGVSADKFNPTADITRGDFVKIVVNALGLSAEVDGNFIDVDAKASYAKHVAVAKALGIVVGDNGTFRPTEKIKRQDLMTIVYRAMVVAGIDTTTGVKSDLSKFKDRNQIAQYAESSIASLVKAGIVNGSNESLNPLSNTSRAEAATIIYRITNK